MHAKLATSNINEARVRLTPYPQHGRGTQLYLQLSEEPIPTQLVLPSIDKARAWVNSVSSAWKGYAGSQSHLGG